MRFSKRMQQLEASVFTRLEAEKQRLLEMGEKVYDFTIGSPDVAPSRKVMQALVHAAQDEKSYMYSLHDTPEFKQAVQAWYAKRYHVQLKEDEILSLQGSQEGLAHIALTVCDEGDIVLIPAPSYPIFANGPRIAGAKLYEMPMLPQHGYQLQLQMIPEAVAEKAKMMIVSYPNNPTGAVASDAFYEELIRFAKRYDILVVHDTAYSNLVFDGRKGKSFLAYEGAKDVGIEFNSFSKAYGMAGARIGICVGNKEAVGMLRKLKSNIDYGMFLPIQKAAVMALTQDQTSVRQTCQRYEARRDLLVDGLRSLGWLVTRPQATMFVWAKIPDEYQSSEDFAMTLLKQSGVLVTPGSAFGSYGEGYVRIALVQPKQVIQEALLQIQKAGLFAR